MLSGRSADPFRVTRRCNTSVAGQPRPLRAVLLPPRVASGHITSDGTPSSAQAVLDRYQALLSEYRLHKQSLGDWFSSVLHTTRRTPQLLDAQQTGDEALVTRFQQYLMVRKRLLAEIPLLREQLDEALAQDAQHHNSINSSSSSNTSSSSSHHMKHKQGVNANQAAPVTKSQAVGQFFSAVNYRKQQGVRAAAAAAAAAAATAAAAAGGIEGSDVEAFPEVAQAQAAVAALVSHHAAAASASAAALAATASSVPSWSTAGIPQPQQQHQPQQQQQQQHVGTSEDAVSHILSAATSSSSTRSGASGRATAAAMAALAYKKRKQAGSSAAAAGADPGSSSHRQQRPLAFQMAEPPPPPPGYVAPGSAAAVTSDAQQQQAAAAVPLVETGKMDVVYARAPRRKGGLDTELSLEATLQGIPGGLGGDLSGQLFAATTVLEGTATPAAAAASGDVQLQTASSSTSSNPQQQQQQQPAGEVLTARFDVYSGRRRVLDETKLDEFLAGLSEAYSSHPAAADGADGATASEAAATTSSGKQQQRHGSKTNNSSSLRSAGLSGSQGGFEGDSGPLMPPDILPVPT